MIGPNATINTTRRVFTTAASLTPTMRFLVSLLLVFALGIASSDRTLVGAITAPGGSSAAATGSPPPIDADGDADSSVDVFRAMHAAIQSDENPGAFLAALDQSGGSTPKALAAYGMGPEEGNYEVGTESMFDAVHSMRTRFMTSSCFKGDRILGAILFENTMDRSVEGLPTCEYLWNTKGIVPFLKIDKGLRVMEAIDVEKGGIEIVEGESSVQILNPIPDLEALLQRAKAKGVYGTKARSLILDPKHPEQIDALVKQQFLLARRVLREGLIPIIEPEVDVTQVSSEKQACEEILCRALLRELDILKEEESLYESDDEIAKPDSKTLLGEALHQVMIKISLPETPNQYQDCVDHPCCLKVVALSGGYDQTEANAKLSLNRGIIASFSRALAEGLSHGMAEDEFESILSESLAKIYEASSSSS